MKWFRNNSLSLVFSLLFLFTMVGQVVTGLKQHNEERIEKGGQAVSISDYLGSGHFLQATFENWESEFLQMTMFVLLTIFLYQKGSSESKDPEGEEDVDRKPDPGRRGAPWPVRRGGWILKIYQNSLFLAFLFLFLGSFLLHWYGSLRDYNEGQILQRKPPETAIEYLGNSRLWFESFQNWGSEFLSVVAIVLLSVFLRQKGSPQSKPVDAPNSETSG